MSCADSYREDGVPYGEEDGGTPYQKDGFLFVDGKDGEWTPHVRYEPIDANVGDKLIFRVGEYHDLWRLRDADAYDNCDFTDGTLVAGNGAGEVMVALDECGDHYFACSVSEHCSNDHSDHAHDHQHHDHGDAYYPQKVRVSVTDGGENGKPCESSGTTFGGGLDALRNSILLLF